MSIFDTFRERGFFQQVTHPEELQQAAQSGRICAYIGFDPTADSLHIGSLVPLLALRRFQEQGHRPLLLLGGV